MRPMATTPRDSLKLDILVLLGMGLAMPACAQQTQAVVPTLGLEPLRHFRDVAELPDARFRADDQPLAVDRDLLPPP